ncbi:multicopper oxidase family protein [Paracraurococcus ruber]|nr:multicopper oxidase domain-containing protein [Paracraurococcus ruber]TDG27595.1 multicopper oxidase family protein [Paracraurococcus ruber]
MPRRHGPARRGALGLALLLSLLAGPALAQERAFQPPADATIQRDSREARRLSAPGLRGPVGTAPRQASLDLAIREVAGRIWNPNTGRHDRVRLRGYVDAGLPRGARVLADRIVAPTIRVTPGDTVRMTLRNELPAEPDCPVGGGHDGPGCFNSTNMHSHGLWVSPTGNSDNVLLDLRPGSVFQYEYNIPADHPAGTFWYHPHRHGSTALQVASGMAGALVIEGSRKPGARADEPGDIDVLTRGMPEKLLLFGQIPYGCFRDGLVQTVADGADKGQFTCAEGETGLVQSFFQQLGFGTMPFPGWGGTGRFTTVNGEVQPVFTMTAGRVERWRLLHAGTAAQIGVSLRPVAPGRAVPPGGVPAAQAEAFVASACGAARLPLFEIQTDGLTRAAVRETAVDWLQSGYRSDLLVAAPEPGLYCLVDEPDPATTTTRTLQPQALLGIVRVLPAPQRVTLAPAALVRDALVRAAQARLTGPARDRVLAELQDRAGIRLASFTWHRPILASELTGRQTLEFQVNDLDPQPPGGPPPQPTAAYLVDNAAYDPAVVNRQLPLGGVEEWTLTANQFPHAFHIHVNPFQVVSATTADGKDAFAVDPLYAGMKDAWKDTLLVNQGYTVVIRTRYQRYIGEFVLHCHVLDHEDQGMMQNVVVTPPGVAARRVAAEAHRH